MIYAIKIHVTSFIPLICLIVFSGCAVPEPKGSHTPPVDYADVVSDGFHTGITIKMNMVNKNAGNERVTVGFGNEKWCLDEGNKFWIVTTSIFMKSDGIVVFSRDKYDKNPKIHFQYTIPLNQYGKKALGNFILNSLDTRASALSFFNNHILANRSRLQYSVWYNCNDYVADALRKCGFPIGKRWIRTSGSLNRDIRKGLKAAQAKQILSFGITPPPRLPPTVKKPK